MKKSVILTLTLILVLSLTVVSNALSEVKVVVNNEAVNFPDAKPYINKDNRTLVPVRFIAENLGCDVDWDNEIRQVGIMGMGKDIKLNVGENKALVDGENIEFDTKAIIKEDRTFVPLRFVSEALGAKVEWNNETRTVLISTATDETVTSVEINDFDEADKVDFSVIINTLKPLEEQYSEAEKFLENKIGKELTKQVMEHVKKKTNWRDELAMKYWDWENKKIQVISNSNNALITISAW